MKQHILLIDENKEELNFFLDSLKQVPHDDGFKCTYASCTTQAKDMLKLLIPDFIFADFEISCTDGTDFINFITTHPRLQHIKFFVYSAKSEEELNEIAALFGTGILRKTGSPDFLVKKLCRLFAWQSKREYGFSDW